MQRLFFALWPPLELSRELFRLGGQLLPTGTGRRVVAENIHLTLTFLGSVDAATRECAEAAASQVHADAFSMKLARAGCWPKSGILWVGPDQTPERLMQLVGVLNSDLVKCGHIAEKRPYTAHVTLAREARPSLSERLVDVPRWEIDHFCLVQSHTLREGARYEILREWKLKKPAE